MGKMPDWIGQNTTKPAKNAVFGALIPIFLLKQVQNGLKTASHNKNATFEASRHGIKGNNRGESMENQFSNGRALPKRHGSKKIILLTKEQRREKLARLDLKLSDKISPKTKKITREKNQ